MDSQREVQHRSPSVSTIARWGRIAFTGVAGLFLAALAFQVFLAGMSIFFDPTWWQVHTTTAFVIENLLILMMVLALLAGPPA